MTNVWDVGHQDIMKYYINEYYSYSSRLGIAGKKLE